jgi:hypothetical protein
LANKIYLLIFFVYSFHPNQLANYYIAKELVEWMEKNHPTWLSPINPNNQEIITHFGP